MTSPTDELTDSFPRSREEELYCYPSNLQQQEILSDSPLLLLDEPRRSPLADDFDIEWDDFPDSAADSTRDQAAEESVPPNNDYVPTPGFHQLPPESLIPGIHTLSQCKNRERFVAIRNKLFEPLPADTGIEEMDAWLDVHCPGHDHPEALQPAVQNVLENSFEQWKLSRPAQVKKYIAFCDEEVLKNMYARGVFAHDGIHPKSFRAGLPQAGTKEEKVTSSHNKKKRKAWVAIDALQTVIEDEEDK